MDYKIKSLPKSQVELTITVPEDKMSEYRKKACDDISKEVKVKGFRPGHVPPEVLESHIDKKYITAHAQEIAIQKTYATIVIKEKIQVVSAPKVKIEKDEPLTFTATVAILPEVEIKDHKSIKIPKEDIKVSKKDIEEVLTDIKRHSTTYKKADRPAKKGDRVEVDFEGFDEKEKPVENTKSKNHPVIIGENSLIPGFEDELIGMKKDEKKEFKITFPKDYGKKDFQNKKMKFKVELKSVEEAIIPEINEDFIEKIIGKKQSVEDFEKEIEKNIHAKKEEEAEQNRENKYIEALLKKTKIEVPEQLIDEEAEYILKDVKNDIEAKGLQFDKFLEQAKTKEDDLKKKYRPEAEKRIKIRLALQYLIKEEKIDVNDEDIKMEMEKLKAYYPKTEHGKIEKEFKSGKLKANLTNSLALRKLFKKVLE
jgi:trigger factor